MGLLMTHEIMMKHHNKDEKENKKKKKMIALKSFTQDEYKEDEEFGDSESGYIALFSKKYKRYLKSRRKTTSSQISIAIIIQ